MAVSGERRKSSRTRSILFAKPPAWWAILMVIICSVLTAALSMGYASYVDKKSSRQWCDVVVTLDDAYRAAPPSSSTGKKLAEDMARLRKNLQCLEDHR